MFILGELFRSLAYLVDALYTILYFLLAARIIISWFPVDPYHGLVQLLVQITDPILVPFQKIPLRIGVLDLTPLLAFVALFFVRNILVALLMNLARQLGGGMAGY